MSIFCTIGGVAYQLDGSLTASVIVNPPVTTPPPTTVPPATTIGPPITTPPPSSGSGVDFVPALISNSSSGYVVSATSEYSEGGITAAAYKAFNKVQPGSGWGNSWSSATRASTSVPQILKIILPSPSTCSAYKIKIRDDSVALSPIAWIFRGLRTDGQWMTIHEKSNVIWSEGETKTFASDSADQFSAFEWVITDSGVLCQIGELSLLS